MENFKALLAVAMFVGLLLFSSFQSKSRQGLPAKQVSHTKELPDQYADTLVIR